MLYPLSRALLFRLDPELAHRLALAAVARVGAVTPLRAALRASLDLPETEPVTAFGLRFANRVGLAAGYDKDGDAWRGLAALGFGHIELGTVTPEPQPGNPRPRLFRLPEASSLINRMGFPGKGAAHLARRLRGSRPRGLVLGVNIGKQRSTPIEAAAGDYEALVETFAPLADYLAVNVSSPNTPGLRRLQEERLLAGLLEAIARRRDAVAERIGRRAPVLVKLAPDLDDEQLRRAIDAIVTAGLDGVIATNTTVSRLGLDHPLAGEEGGLSGAALAGLSTEVVARVRAHAGEGLPIVGVGGVMGADEALAKVEAGATLVQVYTGLVYGGPGVVGRIVRAIG